VRLNRRGSLSVVGLGIRAPAQTTLEARARIEHAEKIYALLSNPLAHYWVHHLNKNVETLADLYAEGKERRQTYREMAARLTDSVHKGLRVCAVSYGHPGVFADPFHEAVRQLRKEGFQAEMLPAVSAEDCLIAELGVDPAAGGCRSYEATDFLIYRRGLDTTSALLLWQIGAIGELGYKNDGDRAWNPGGILLLVERLLEAYASEHEVIVFEAASLPLCSSKIIRVALQLLPTARVTVMSTLYVPATTKPTPDPVMLRRLRLVQAPAQPITERGN
jgi:Tetrapyrrole (Corrin/Porphyrin) Methylases